MAIFSITIVLAIVPFLILKTILYFLVRPAFHHVCNAFTPPLTARNAKLDTFFSIIPAFQPVRISFMLIPQAKYVKLALGIATHV